MTRAKKSEPKPTLRIRFRKSDAAPKLWSVRFDHPLRCDGSGNRVADGELIDPAFRARDKGKIALLLFLLALAERRDLKGAASFRWVGPQGSPADKLVTALRQYHQQWLWQWFGYLPYDRTTFVACRGLFAFEPTGGHPAEQYKVSLRRGDPPADCFVVNLDPADVSVYEGATKLDAEGIAAMRARLLTFGGWLPSQAPTWDDLDYPAPVPVPPEQAAPWGVAPFGPVSFGDRPLGLAGCDFNLLREVVHSDGRVERTVVKALLADGQHLAGLRAALGEPAEPLTIDVTDKGIWYSRPEGKQSSWRMFAKTPGKLLVPGDQELRFRPDGLAGEAEFTSLVQLRSIFPTLQVIDVEHCALTGEQAAQLSAIPALTTVLPRGMAGTKPASPPSVPADEAASLAAGPPPSLLLIQRPDATRFAIRSERFVIGSGPDCEVVIPHDSVCAEHAQIVRHCGKYYVEDKQSRNGTYHNGQQVSPRAQLNHNDQIRIGDFVAVFQTGEGRADAPAAPAPQVPAPAAPAEQGAATYRPADQGAARGATQSPSGASALGLPGSMGLTTDSSPPVMATFGVRGGSGSSSGIDLAALSAAPLTPAPDEDADRPNAESLVLLVRGMGLLSAEQLGEAEQVAAALTTADALAYWLVSQGHLTSYQAAELCQGRGAGLVVGSYVVLDKIGAGGMGEVFRARHRVMKREVALKRILAKRLGSASAVARFLREVQAASRLSHPNVVNVYDAGEAGGSYFLAMEWLRGETLSEHLARRGRLGVVQAVNFVRQACLGMQHAHERGLVHRDLKPHNLFLTAEAQVKVLDLGLARVDGASVLTRPGMTLGTVDYMAPEQVTDSSQVDVRADVYSLGCTLYHLLAGHTPFHDAHPVARPSMHLSKEPPPLESVRSEVPARLAGVVRKMMAKSREDRHQTPGEAAAALSPEGWQGWGDPFATILPRE